MVEWKEKIELSSYMMERVNGREGREYPNEGSMPGQGYLVNF